MIRMTKRGWLITFLIWMTMNKKNAFRRFLVNVPPPPAIDRPQWMTMDRCLFFIHLRGDHSSHIRSRIQRDRSKQETNPTRIDGLGTKSRLPACSQFESNTTQNQEVGERVGVPARSPTMFQTAVFHRHRFEFCDNAKRDL